MAKLYNKLTQIMGHAFNFNFTLCNFSLVPSLFFTREAKNRLDTRLLYTTGTGVLQICYAQTGFGESSGHETKIWPTLYQPTLLSSMVAIHIACINVNVLQYRTRPSLVVFPNQLILFPWLYVSIYIRVWGVEGEKWMCKTVLTDGHQRTIRSG